MTMFVLFRFGVVETCQYMDKSMKKHEIVSCSVIQTQVSPGEISGITGFCVHVVVSDTF